MNLAKNIIKGGRGAKAMTEQKIALINISSLKNESLNAKLLKKNTVNVVRNSRELLSNDKWNTVGNFITNKKKNFSLYNPKTFNVYVTVNDLNFKKAAAGLKSKSFAISQNLYNWVITTSLLIFSFCSYFLFLQ